MVSCLAVGGGTESCCTSLEVPGGKYYRTYNLTDAGQPNPPADGGPTGEADPATVSGLRLDKYLVTVGRFRQFVNHGVLPTSGAGIHEHLNGGQGLANSGGPPAYEGGWDESWNAQVSTDWNTALQCDACGGENFTWTSAVGGNENLPINCVDWYEAYAFCIWDGGFLPSEAEWEYVAAGGSQQREYAWGPTAQGTGNQYAIYDWYYTGTPTDIAPVGFASSGVALWGRQLDMAGEVWEWNLDWYGNYVEPCTDCAYLPTSGALVRLLRGGSFNSDPSSLLASNRNYDGPTYGCDGPPENRSSYYGFRCARTP